MFFYYGIVPVQISIKLQPVQFTTLSRYSSHACDNHMQGRHKSVCRDTGLHFQLGILGVILGTQCFPCLTAAPDAGHPEEPGETFSGFQHKPVTNMGSADLEVHI